MMVSNDLVQNETRARESLLNSLSVFSAGATKMVRDSSFSGTMSDASKLALRFLEEKHELQKIQHFYKKKKKKKKKKKGGRMFCHTSPFCDIQT